MTDDDIARRAKEILEDAVFAEALKRVEDQFQLDFRQSAPPDTAKREAAYAGLRALDLIRTKLQGLVDHPKITAHNSGSKTGKSKV